MDGRKPYRKCRILLIFVNLFSVWCLDLLVCCLDLSVGCLDLPVECLDLSFGCSELYFGCLDLSFGVREHESNVTLLEAQFRKGSS